MKETGLVKIPIAINSNEVNRELLLAEKTFEDTFILCSIPAFTYGFGLGDEIGLINAAEGKVKLVKRAGNVTIRLFKVGSLNNKLVNDFVEKLESQGGVYEVALTAETENARSLLLVSLPFTYGFRNIEKDMLIFEGDDYSWEYGNIYDDKGELLGWWKD
jgi:hypothetical protein